MKLLLKSAALVLLLCASAAAFGQSLVDGRVVFGNRFKPVQVTVHLVNKAHKPPIDLIQQTTSDGRYSFDDVPPGKDYAVAVYDATGKLVGTDPQFEVLPEARHTALPDLDLAKGVLADREVKSGGLIQNDTSTSPGANITNQQLRVLPLYNRTFLALGLIQPGVHDVPPGSPLQGAGFSIAGSRPTSTNFLLDGVDNVASSNNQAIPFQVNEAVQEFRVIYAAPDMRYGQGAGGVVDVVTSRGSSPTGSKAFHGSLFDYINTDALNAGSPLSVYSTTTFAKAAATASDGTGDQVSAANRDIIAVPGQYFGYAPQRYNQLYNLVSPESQIVNNVAVNACLTNVCRAGSFNPAALLAGGNDNNKFPITSQQFGASAGGPLLHNNKLFLFGSYEGTRIDNPTPIFERVPTALDAPAPGVTASDAGIARGVLGLFPAPNVGQTGTALLTGTGAGIFGFYRGYAPNYTHVHNVHFRPDLSLGHLGTVSFRYTGQLIDQLHDDTLPAGGAYPGNGANRKAQNQSAAVTHNFPFGQSINTANIGFTQFRVDEVAQDRGFNPASIGLPAGSMSTIAISGIDTRTTGAAPGTAGLMGGWYDSFWNSCTNGSVSNCSANTVSPSLITPSLDGQFPLARIGAPLEAPSRHRDTEAFFSDLLSLHLGRGTLLLGGDYRYQQNYSYDGSLARGLVISNNIGEFTSDSETCVSCGLGTAFQHPSFDYELRQPTGYTGDLRSSTFGVFGEHRLQPTPQLTLSGGIRYQFYGQPLDGQNRLWNYNRTDQGLVRQGSRGTFDAFDYQCGAGQSTTLDSLYGNRRVTFPGGWNCIPSGAFGLPNNNTSFMGHFGLAYAPDAKYHTVLRASVGLYDDHLPAAYNEQLLHNRPNPYNVTNPSAIYGQNFYSPACGQAQTQCGFGLHTLNFGGLTETDQSTFQNYQASSGANIMYERDAARLSTPYSLQYTTSIQHSFGPSWSGEVAYVGSFNRALPLIYDSNFANEFYCTQGGGSVTSPGGLCNNNTFFPVFTEANIGSSSYHSLVVRVRTEQYHGLSLHAAFTLSKSLDDIAGSSFPRSTDALFTQIFGRQLFGLGNPTAFAIGANSLSNPNVQSARYSQLAPTANGLSPLALQLLQSANIPSFNPVSSALTTTGSRAIEVSQYSLPQNPLSFSGSVNGGDYGRSDFDVRSRGVADFVYAPGFHNRWAKDFVLSGIFTAQSGQPFSIFSGPAYGQVTQRISLTPGSTVRTTGNPAGYFSGVSRNNLASISAGNACPSLYAQPTLYSATSNPAACVGNSGRNAWSGPVYISQDLALQRALTFGERQSVILRAEGYNVFNRANYYNPISELSNDGIHINPEFGLIRSAHDPREVQFAARYQF